MGYTLAQVFVCILHGRIVSGDLNQGRPTPTSLGNVIHRVGRKARPGQLPTRAVSKNNIRGKIESRNIRRIGKEDDLYKLPGTTGDERMLIENAYKELYENGYDTLYKLMIDEI